MRHGSVLTTIMMLLGSLAACEGDSPPDGEQLDGGPAADMASACPGRHIGPSDKVQPGFYQMTPMPGVAGYTAGAPDQWIPDLAKRIVVAGGTRGRDKSGATTATYVYDICTGTWSTGAPLPVSVHGHGMAGYKNKVYAVGGYGNPSGTLVYDLATNTWVNGPDLNTPRALFGLAQVGNLVYVAGGVGTGYLDSVEVLDLDQDTPTWKELASLPEALYGLGLAWSQGDLYAIGGSRFMGNTQIWSNAVYKYNVQANTWSRVSGLVPELMNMTGTVAVSQGDGIYFTFDGGQHLLYRMFPVENGVRFQKVAQFPIDMSQGETNRRPIADEFSGPAAINMPEGPVWCGGGGFGKKYASCFVYRRDPK